MRQQWVPCVRGFLLKEILGGGPKEVVILAFCGDNHILVVLFSNIARMLYPIIYFV